MPTDLTPVDDDLAEALAAERDRQRETLSLIASENHASDAVLRAQGSVLTNKYAEGQPGERYYAGCEHADAVEELAVERATELFGAEHANVQPHSGTSANLAAYQALLESGDRILSLEMTHGGHLSHGQPYTMVDDHFAVSHYGVDEATGRLDYDALEARAEEVDPDLIVSGYSAYPRQVDWERVQAVADAVDAYHVADIAHVTGLVAAGVHPSPVGVADLVTGSTHKTIRAGRGGMIVCGEEHADAVDTAVMPGTQGGPLMHNVAGKAAGFGEALDPAFEEYAGRVVENATALGDRLDERGFDLVSGGTDVHFVVVDFRDTHPDLTGERAEASLADVGLIANKQTVPGEERSSTVGSGVRIGTPAVTTRGFDADAMRRLADAVADVLDAPDDESVRTDARQTVADLCERFPLYDAETAVTAR
ncbi:serine hydroxymethyltransferase [Halomicrobium salinisoli]|uniref:serine hydroxymethyltransferase n=1 Tax=Halomicrobium salinisoli TaxID=2878391 RepID=UPI001CEFE886|nr:serine hydroxymethyltransferase [Halomicrobium salinisoli]